MKSTQTQNRRRGIAMGMVILIGLVVLVLGMAMITTSGGLLQSSVDAKQRIRSRYAAEAMIALELAKLDAAKSISLGAALKLDAYPLSQLRTGFGEQAKADAIKEAKAAGQDVITSGFFRGMKGYKMPFLIHSTGIAPGGAKTQIDAVAYLYQVPIFQFGVFYDGDLEITPGPQMTVYGPVHTNGNAYFRSANDLSFQGPVTVSGTLFQWHAPGTDNLLHYNLSPEAPAAYTPILSDALEAMNANTQPPPVDGVHNVAQGSERLTLPIGGAKPRDLISPCNRTSDPPALQSQKFDCLVPKNSSARFINQGAPPPAWITGPKVFFDRREDRWVKFWDVDVVAALAANPRDSIFYLNDPVAMNTDRGMKKSFLLNAFRLRNGTYLTRNASFVSQNPVYILGDYNKANPAGKCRPADAVGAVNDSLKYCNSMIAADAVTLLSQNWTNNDFAHRVMDGSLEQPLSNGPWTVARAWEDPPFTRKGGFSRNDGTEFTFGFSDEYYKKGPPPNIRINAAILTGNKPTNPVYLAPGTSDAVFAGGYEGGWHNTFRFLEDLHGVTVEFRGSFICLWKAASPGLDTLSTKVTFGTNAVDQNSVLNGKYALMKPDGYFFPPTRGWGFDDRFSNINNMPPGTPFLSTGIFTNWSERQ